MVKLKNIFVGFLISFIGSIPLGYLNVVGYEVFTKFGLNETIFYLLGIISIEFFVIYFTLLFAKQLMNNQKLITHGPQNQFAEYTMLPSDENESSIQMLFYGIFDKENIMTGVNMRFSYNGWFPNNANLYADKLVPKLKDTLLHWFPGNDFLSEICVLWEKAALQFNSINIRTVVFRTGVVFSKEGGALEKIIKPIKFNVGAALGTGKQYMPWIAMEDLCYMYVSAIENSEFNGIYNAVAPDHVTNKELTKSIAKTLKKTLWLPNIPSFFLKIMLGELAVILLEGSRVSSEKIKSTGFKFKYNLLKRFLLEIKN